MFQDEILVNSNVWKPNELITTNESLGISKVEYVKKRDAKFIPRLLRVPCFWKTMTIIAGEK